MSRARFFVALGVVLVFALVGGVVIYATEHKGGQSLTFDVTVTSAASMSPASLSAHLNDTVTINIVSDTDGEVHLHVYDIAFNVKSSQAVSHTFKADKTCNCIIEWESTGKELGTLVVSP